MLRHSESPKVIGISVINWKLLIQSSDVWELGTEKENLLQMQSIWKWRAASTQASVEEIQGTTENGPPYARRDVIITKRRSRSVVIFVFLIMRHLNTFRLCVGVQCFEIENSPVKSKNTKIGRILIGSLVQNTHFKYE